MKYTKEQILKCLTTHQCVVKFTKVNGELREMPCTLKPDVVPKFERKTPVKESTKESNTISVWCTDKQAWRSFRVDSVLDIQVDLGMPIVI